MEIPRDVGLLLLANGHQLLRQRLTPVPRQYPVRPW
jgi:hypothetical protein